MSAELTVVPEKLLSSLSYSHFELLAALDDEIKRSFYEIECMCGNWSVRELKRQIGSLYYERSSLSQREVGRDLDQGYLPPSKMGIVGV